MALGNKGYALSTFHNIVRGESSTVLLCESYLLLNEALKQNLDYGPQKYFQSILNRIEKYLPDIKKLAPGIICKDILVKPKKSFKYFYQSFCHQHQLYFLLKR